MEVSDVITRRGYNLVNLLFLVGMAVEFILGCNASGWQAGVICGFAFLLLSLSASLWALSRSALHRRWEFARIYAAAFRGSGEHLALSLPAAGTGSDRLATLFAEIIRSTKLAMAGREPLARWAEEMRGAVAARLSQSATVAAALGEDAHAITEYAATSRKAQSTLTEGIAEMRDRAAKAAQATSSMIMEAEALGTSVRSLTAQTNRATAIMSHVASDVTTAQRKIAGMADALAELSAVISDAGIDPDQTRALESLAANLSALTMDAAELRVAIDGIGQSVQRQAEWGETLLRGITQQGLSISRVVAQMERAHSEVASVSERAQIIDLNKLMLSAGPAARKAVERLPAHADAMAQLLRGLPDLKPAAVR